MLGTLLSFLLPALRYIFKKRVFIVLNLLGLSIGLTISLLLFQYAYYEFSYDKFHENSKRIYRIRYDNYRDGKAEFKSAAAVPAVGKAMKDNFPEVEEYAWAYPVKNGFFSIGDRSIHEAKFQIATPGFLKLFSWEFMQGDTSALSHPNSMVVTESFALKCFGTTHALNKELQYEDGTEYTIRGIIRDIPQNSHIKFSMLVSPEVMYQWFENESVMWTWYDFNTYILLREGADPGRFEKKFDSWLSEELADFWKKDNRRQYFRLQSIEKIHLYSRLSQESEPGESGNGKLVIILSFVAISILIIAWINYINLSSSMAWSRTKEIGLRKVMGAGRRHIIALFVGEALIMNLLAAGISLALIELALPEFSELIGRELSMSLLKDPVFWIFLTILLSTGSFISGIYPAWTMSAQRPIDIINGAPADFRSGLLLRKVLVIMQFIVSIGFISGSFLTYSQLHFIRSIPSGIDINQTLVVWGPGSEYDSSYAKYDRNFKNTITSLPEVHSVSSSDNVPGIEIYLSEILRRPGEENGQIYYNLTIDENFIPSYELEILAGRNFHNEMDDSGHSVILNESAAKKLGFSSPEEAIGKKLIYSGDEQTIIGVIKDYYQMSTKQEPRPLIHYYHPLTNTYISLKMRSASPDTALARIENVWSEFFPGVPFESFYLEEFCEGHYRMDKQIHRAIRISAILAIFIAVLGLFGLSTYTTQQRNKEIGIRKVNGATVSSILIMLFNEYFHMILIAFAISTPLTWLVISKWLDTYYIHIKIQPHVFFFGGLIVMNVAFLFVFFRTIRVANMNPTDALRNE